MQKDTFDTIGWPLVMFLTWVGVVTLPIVAVAMAIAAISLSAPGLFAGALAYAALWPVTVVQLRVTRYIRTQMDMD